MLKYLAKDDFNGFIKLVNNKLNPQCRFDVPTKHKKWF